MPLFERSSIVTNGTYGIPSVPGHLVTVDVTGGRQETARTGPDGRAQFAHLPVGVRVRVSALVENSGKPGVLVVADGRAIIRVDRAPRTRKSD